MNERQCPNETQEHTPCQISGHYLYPLDLPTRSYTWTCHRSRLLIPFVKYFFDDRRVSRSTVRELESSARERQHHTSENDMKKRTEKRKLPDELRPEYDLSNLKGGVRGKYTALRGWNQPRASLARRRRTFSRRPIRQFRFAQVDSDYEKTSGQERFLASLGMTARVAYPVGRWRGLGTPAQYGFALKTKFTVFASLPVMVTSSDCSP